MLPRASAQELEPRSYTNVPVDQTFLAVGAVRSGGATGGGSL